MEEIDKQLENSNHSIIEREKEKSKVPQLLPYQWKKGQSGNIMGRPKGKTMKEYAREYLERMSDEERDEWLEGISKDKIWEMAEGKAKQDVDANVTGDIKVNIINYGNTDTSSI